MDNFDFYEVVKIFRTVVEETHITYKQKMMGVRKTVDFGYVLSSVNCFWDLICQARKNGE